MSNTELIVMLTHNDFTVENAYQVFESCKDTDVKFWGFKEKGISTADMKVLFDYMKKNGKTTVLEVVEYDEASSLKGAKTAQYCGCDILMGTTYFESVNTYCQDNSVKYMPFAGNISGRPSILEGNIETIIQEAKSILNKNVFGFDLLGYRYTGNAIKLISDFVKELDAPVVIAGSIDSYDKLDFVKSVDPWAFTIGSAFFENKFDGSFKEQVEKVYHYIKNN
ncbi:hypothetical protein [Staphylococcus gallinarum]|uniref:hypothetical protein n=2 Tax=Staphylococcus gallinarum TaxID=1293 RepID=UPI001E3E9D32|nr:hypothetical protein [Staphylococcus gallinarum]MCD8871705.1 hypothetical protein [Staphylococcus gallinarum]MCW0986054.1 hypothetical protein [Staphylococcus gallinarum]